MQGTKPIAAIVVAKSATRFTKIKTLLASIDATIKVRRVQSLEQLSAAVQQYHPRIITVYLDGITAADLEQIRRTRALSPTSAVITLMTSTSPQEIDSLLQAGADDCLEIRDESRLQRVLKVHLANQRFRQELEQRSQEFQNLTQKLNFYIQNTTEGIWCFEAPEPIPLELPTEVKVTRSFDSICVECNNAYAAMFGLQRSDLLGKKLAELMPDNEINRAYLTQFFENDNYIENAESLEYDPQGNEKHFLNSMYAEIENGRLVRAWGRQVDITPVRRRAAEMEKALQRFRAVWESSLDGLCILDAQGLIVQANPAFCQMMGKSCGEIEGQPLNTLFHFTPKNRIHHQHLSFWDQRVKAYHQIHDVTLWNGNRIQMEVTSTALISDQGEGLILSIFHDVTEERRSAQRLAEISQRFQWLYEYAPSGYHILKPDGTIIDVNTKWCQMMGYSKEEVIGRPIFDFVAPHEREASRRSFQLKIESRVRFTQPNERVFQTRSGQEIACLIHDYFTYDENENLVQVLTTIQDISERRRMEEELRESERQLTTLIDNIPGLVYRCRNDRDWTMEYLSPACKEITGYEPEELIGNRIISFNDLIHPDHRKRLWEKWQKLLSQQAVFEDEYPITTKSGETRWVWERGRGVFDDQGNVLFLEGIITDITARRQTEEALKRERALLRTVLDNLPDAIYAKDTACRKTLTNVVDLHNLGCKTEAEVLGKDDFAFYPKDVAEAFCRDDRYVLDTGNPIINREEKIQCADGTEGHLLTSKVPLRDENGQIIGLVGIGHDITERKKTELALRESEAKFRALAESSPAAIFIYQQNRFVYANPATEKLTGCTQEQLMQLNFWDVVHPDFRELVKERGLARQRGEPVPSHYEFKIITSNGEERWIDFAGAVTTYAGQPAAIGFAYDVTERKQVEEALRESEEKYRLLAETTPDVIILHDMQGCIQYVNRSGLELIGLKAEEVIGRPIAAFIPPEFQNGVRKRQESRASGDQNMYNYEVQVRNKDGQNVYLEIYSAPIVTEGRVQQILIVARDITERKKMESQLKAEKEWSERLITQAPNIVIGLEEGSKIAVFNSFAEKLTGYKAEEVIGKEWIEKFVPEEQREVVYKAWDQIIAKQAIDLYFENEIVTKSGERRLIEWHNSLISENGKFKMVLALGVDITERRRAEAALRESEERFRRLAENAQDLIYRYEFSPERRFTYVSPIATTMTGYTPEDHYADPDLGMKLIHPEDRPLLEKYFQGQGVFREPLTLRWVRKDGTILWTEQRNVPIFDEAGNLVALEGIARDVTERKLAEERIRQSEETYRNLFQNAQVGLFRTRIADGKILECNDQMAHMFGYDSREEYIAEYVTSQNYVDPGTRERMLEILRRDGFIQNFEARFYRKDRSIFWSRFSARIYPEQGWIEGVAEDITARKQAEEALGESEEKLRLLVENMVEVFFQIDLHGRLSYINPAIERMLGFSPEEVLGKEYTDFILGENKERLRKEIAVQAQGRQVFRLFELNLLHKRGSLVVAEISAAPIISSDGTFRGYVGVCRDITEQRKLEEERSRLAKLESLSILAGGIAHDFNNLLTGIMGNISLAKMKNKDQNLGPVLERAERASVRARDLTQQLLTFAKGGEPIREDVPLPELVRESAEFICRGKPVKLEYRFNPDLPPAHVDPGQISQVVQNLVLNSVQAMPHGGTITIAIAPEQIESPSDLPLEPGRYLKLQVRDTGVGIPEKIIDRIFDPYFSTKQSGSGLGLAIVHSILKRHHAHITVQSRYGEGTTFTIYLPAGEGLPKDEQASTETAAPSGGRVLLMDDEELVLEVGRAMLESLGYEVETAPEGQKALAMYRAAREAGKPFDVVIMDLTIAGGLGGKETIEELKKYDPEARAIVSSGYSNDPIMANPKNYGFDDVVDKPYNIQKLQQALVRTIRRPQN